MLGICVQYLNASVAHILDDGTAIIGILHYSTIGFLSRCLHLFSNCFLDYAKQRITPSNYPFPMSPFPIPPRSNPSLSFPGQFDYCASQQIRQSRQVYFFLITTGFVCRDTVVSV